MLRVRLAGSLAALMLAAAPAGAHAQLTATAPADGHFATQGDAISFTGSVSGGSFSEIRIVISASRQTDGAGKLTGTEQFPPSTYTNASTWTVPWTARAAGILFWQAQRTDCSAGACTDQVTAPRQLNVAAHPSLVRPAPTPARPADGARVTLGRSVNLAATDTHASRLIYEVSTSPALLPDGRFASPAHSKTVNAYQNGISYRPPASGTYYWHAIRESCLLTNDTIPGTTHYLPVDCTSRAVSHLRAFRAAPPRSSLRLSGSSYAYRSGPIHFELRCANPPCRVTVTGTFTGKGSGPLPRLRTSLTKKKSKLTFHTLRASRRQQRRIAATVARRGRVKLVLRAKAVDAFNQRSSARKAITLRKPKPPKPRKPKSPEQRAAERAVGLRVAEYYQVGEDRTSASCKRSSGSADWKCRWETDMIEEPWGEDCWYSGEADASRISGDWWDIRLYDIDDSCYDSI